MQTSFERLDRALVLAESRQRNAEIMMRESQIEFQGERLQRKVGRFFVLPRAQPAKCQPEICLWVVRIVFDRFTKCNLRQFRLAQAKPREPDLIVQPDRPRVD